MLQAKQSGYDTFETLRNIDTLSSRVHQIRYNINDYLPNDCEYKPAQILQIYRRDDFQIVSSKCRIDDVQSEYENSYKQIIANLQQEVKEKDSKIQKLTCQLQLRLSQYQTNMRKANEQLKQINEKLNKISKESDSNIQKITVLQKNINQQKKIKQLANEELNEIKVQMMKKVKNIRIFCQKYQISIQPKIKQTYTIEVQTEKEKQLKQIKTTLDVQIANYNKVAESEASSNRKVSCHSKPQFYQLYKQHQQNELSQLQAQFTTKSQVLSSGYKPKKPTFIFDNVSEFTDKENDRKKLNQRIDGKSWVSTKQKDKTKIKNQEIQIYPIDENYVEDIVKGILGSA